MNNEIMLNENGSTTKKAPEPSKTYKFAGYDWTVCELVNDGRTAVLQSHGVTSGAWPGYVIPQFGNGNFYAADIDGEDISSYDDKMQALYNVIKEVEDTSATYGKGLYLISKGKAGFTELGYPGSGNYCQALKKAAGNARSFGSPNGYAWLGTVGGGNGAWCVNSNGGVSTTTVRAATMWSPPLSISIYPKLRLPVMKSSSRKVTTSISLKISQIQPHTVPSGNTAWILQKMVKHFILTRKW